MPRLQHTIDRIPGVALFLKPVQDIALDNRVAPTEYQYALTEVDEDELGRFAERMTAALQQRPELADVSNNLAANGLQLNLTINRDQASRLGVPIQTIDDTLYSAFGQRQISTIFTQLNQYRVVLEVDPKFRTSADLLNRLSVRGSGSGVLTGSNATTFGQATSSNSATPSGIGSQGNTGIAIGAGGTIPMASLVDARVVNAPLVISHQNQLPAVTLSFNVANGYSLSDAVEAFAEIEGTIDMPAQIRGSFIGKAAEFSSSMIDEVLLILASLVVIYIVLGVLYESYIHPITIISTLPPAGVGALLALTLCGFSLSIDGIVGIILLIGIVKKNAIMMIDFAIDARDEGMAAHDAIRRAALLRFRPILMTTFAAMFGALPLALGTGIGSELRQPLGVSIVGGLLVSQLITLYTTPVLYLHMERVSDWLAARRERRALVAERRSGVNSPRHFCSSVGAPSGAMLSRRVQRLKSSSRLRGPGPGDSLLHDLCIASRRECHAQSRAFTRLRRASHFLLRGQEKVTKEKATPKRWSPGILSCDYASGLRGFADSTSVCWQRTGRDPSRPPCGPFLRPAATAYGTLVARIVRAKTATSRATATATATAEARAPSSAFGTFSATREKEKEEQ